LRDLVIFRWETNWSAAGPKTLVGPSTTLSPAGEPLTRISLALNASGQALLANVNLPESAQSLTAFVHGSQIGASRYQALFLDKNGFTKEGDTLWEATSDVLYTSKIDTDGFSWRVGFFNLKPLPPLQFRGFRFQTRDPAKLGNCRVEIGPVHVVYMPDDTHWLWADLQPKTMAAIDGKLPAQTLRVANLGTKRRTFILSTTIENRNLIDCHSSLASPIAINLSPGEERSIPVKFQMRLLGRYSLNYTAVDSAGSSTSESDTIAVVNGRDLADGFRSWTAKRNWFSSPFRRPGTDADGKTVIEAARAYNGISDVPLFPSMPRQPSTPVAIDGTMQIKGTQSGQLQVMKTQLSPAWLIRTTSSSVDLFAGSKAAGLDSPTYVGFADGAGKSDVYSRAGSVGEVSLSRMSEPWLMVWWQGAGGWKDWDIPFLVVLQHKPTSLTMTDDGITLKFNRRAGNIAIMPLFGYAKLPQLDSYAKTPSRFRFPESWPTSDLRTWTWNRGLPPSAVDRCRWWSRALELIPYQVKESFAIDHGTGSVHIKDEFSYVNNFSDWGVKPITVAPLSPTFAIARLGGYPIKVTEPFKDWNYPTIFGPYSGIEGSRSIDYDLNIGPYWMQSAVPNLALPNSAKALPDTTQAALIESGTGVAQETDDQAWGFRDGNFVWDMQTDDFRKPALLTQYCEGSLRQDRKSWLQAKSLHELLDKSRYGMDERAGTLTRRYIDGPGIGDWGSGDWGDAGKLGSDMIYDAYIYAYSTGDYQTIADNWDTIVSLNSLPTTMSWIGVGRGSIAEMGDEAPIELALARLAYAVGDREEYAAAVYWYARELAVHVLKEGAFTKWSEQFAPWHTGIELPTETATNLWGTNAGWVGGGFNSSLSGENQWDNFYVRFDDADVLRFQRKYCRELPTRIVTSSTLHDRRLNYNIYFERVAVLGDNPVAAQSEFVQDSGKPIPDSYLTKLAITWQKYPPKLEQLIPATERPVKDNGFAWSQMNQFAGGLIDQIDAPMSNLPAPQWYWYEPPVRRIGTDWGERWTFGEIAPSGTRKVLKTHVISLGPETTIENYDLAADLSPKN